MHAYLLITGRNSDYQQQISELSKKLGAKIMEFPIYKIGDVRDLNNLIKLSFDSPTLIVCKDIHEAGEEASNAFLKNLEEPQKNIFFTLTTSSVRKVLPTIVSRCQIIKTEKTNPPKEINHREIGNFFDLTTGQKLSYMDKIKNRDEAINFIENMAYFMHRSLHQKDVKYKFGTRDIETVLKTLSRLKANGNVNLQCSNLIIQLSNLYEK